MCKTLSPDDHQRPMFPPREESHHSPDMRERQNHKHQQPSPPFLDIERSVVSLSLTNSALFLIQHHLICMHVHLIVCLYMYLNISSLQEIFNHVVGDIEFFTGKVGAAVAQEDGKKKKKKKKDKSTIIYGKLEQCGQTDFPFQKSDIIHIYVFP